MLKHAFFITGTLHFSPRRITLESNEERYFVRPFSLKSGYVHGDVVKAKILKKNNGDKLAEVEVISLLSRSEQILLATITMFRDKKYLEVRQEQGTYKTYLPSDARHYTLGDIVACKFQRDGTFRVLRKFAKEGEHDIEERLILFLSGARTEFPVELARESDGLTAPGLDREVRPSGEMHSIWEKISKAFSFPTVSESTKIHEKKPLFSLLGNRIDFRNWYTLTIDGADAKDLDDAISLTSYENGNFLLGVHIADVAEYVRENSHLDKEALLRATSIYTPGKVIPMLPEKLSNDLCSLHPGGPKYVLSCLMLVDTSGIVKHAEVVEGIIESRRRGIYEEIYEEMVGKNPETPHEHTIFLANELYHKLLKRREKEGKIIFESTEIGFQFEEGSMKKEVGSNMIESLETTPTRGEEDSHVSVGSQGGFISKQKTPINIIKRDRNDAHMMIEEFMVLANEEVAKWCVRHGLPFLSRVHGLPSSENMELIAKMIENSEAKRKLEPHHIRSYMEKISDPLEHFRLSRLLLPKMAKATYADKPFRHFGLALSYYSHFTSPIRRYPDLQVHRIIKEELRGFLDKEKKIHYRSILKKVAKLSSERERTAEDIERAFDALYACRYMQDKIGQSFSGRISGISQYALYIELENGIEGTLYLPRKKFLVNLSTGSLENLHGKELYRIGDEMKVKVEDVDMGEKRIILRSSP